MNLDYIAFAVKDYDADLVEAPADLLEAARAVVPNVSGYKLAPVEYQELGHIVYLRKGEVVGVQKL